MPSSLSTSGSAMRAELLPNHVLIPPEAQHQLAVRPLHLHGHGHGAAQRLGLMSSRGLRGLRRGCRCFGHVVQVPEAERGVVGTPDGVSAAEVLDGKQDARPQALQRVVVVPADVVPSTVRWRTAQRVGEAKSSNDIEEVIWVHASMQRCTLAAGSPSISGRTGASRQAADWPPPACARQRVSVVARSVPRRKADPSHGIAIIN